VTWSELEALRVDPETTGYILAWVDHGDASARDELRAMLDERLSSPDPEDLSKEDILDKVVVAFEESAHDAMRSPERKAHRDAQQTRVEVRAEGSATREALSAQGQELTERISELPSEILAQVGDALASRAEDFRQEQAQGLGAAHASGESSGLARALLLGPLQQIGALDDADAAEQLATEGRQEEAADALISIVDRLEFEGLELASENLRERAAELYSDAGQGSKAADILLAVAEARVERGSALLRSTAEALSEVLPESRQWIVMALRARVGWPDEGPTALDALRRAAEEAAGDPDEELWLAACFDCLSLFGEHQEILTRSQSVGTRPLASGPRLAIELDLLDALESTGQRSEAEARWLETLRWADRDGTAYDSGVAWQRRGFVLARREDIPAAHDAYRRAIEAWSQLPGYEEQAADAFYSLQSSSIANASPVPDLELRPLAAALRGAATTPVSQAERFEAEGMRERLNGKLPDAKRSFWLAFAGHRRMGSLAGHLLVGERLGELYEHARESVPALGFYVLSGNAKEATRVAKVLPGSQVAQAIAVGGPRWERATAYAVIGDVGRTLPAEFVEQLAETLIAEAKNDADSWVAPQPAPAAKRALAQVFLALPPARRAEAEELLLDELDSPNFSVAKTTAISLVLATNAGVLDSTERLVEAFLRDAYNLGISIGWVAQTARRHPASAARLREAALDGNGAALEAVALAELVADDEKLIQACTQETERAARTVVTEEAEEADGGHVVSTSLVHLEGYGIVARFATAEAQRRLVDHLLAIATGRTDPEGTRASAVNSLFNLAPALEVEAAETVIKALAPISLGQYELSRWDENLDHPLSRIRLSLHSPLELRGAAMNTVARLSAQHSGLGADSVAEAVFAAFRDGPESIIAAAFGALGRLTDLKPPIPLEAGMMHPDTSVRSEALQAYVARHQSLPADETLESLRNDPAPSGRLNLLNAARIATDGDRAIEPLREDEDAYVRAMAEQASPASDAS